MDRELWLIIVAAIERALKAVPSVGRRPRYSDRLIVRMLLWIAWQQRSLSWACDRGHYNHFFRPRALPSISQFARRVKTDRVQRLLQHVHEQLALRGTSCPFDQLTYIDGKALVVGPASKDPDAKRGRCCGAFAKGYKLHALVNEHRRVVLWCVTPLNTDEKVVAEELLMQMPPGNAASDTPASIAFSAPLTLADSNYDSAPLHAAFAAQGRCLLAPLRGEQFVSDQGRSKKSLQAMGPVRREVVALWEEHPDLANYVLKQRNNIEGVLSVLSLAGGLDRLPGFVRRLPRVWRWVACKLILYHARQLAQERLIHYAA
jgi:hypothetical protein